MTYRNSENKVLEKSLQQKFNNCLGKATLFVSQKEIHGSTILLFPLYRKIAVVKCNATGQEISKKEWNEQTKIESKNLLENYSLTKKGWYFFLGSFAIVFALIAVLTVFEISNIVAYQKTFNSKTRDEKKEILAKLDVNDLIKTNIGVYKILAVGDRELTVIQSSVKPNLIDINNLIKEKKYAEDSFLPNATLQINRASFLKYTMLNRNLNDEYGGELVTQVLDR